MKISIVTISFNQGKYLEQTINSVLNQKDADVEYIIVDPGSTDNSRDIIETYRSRIDHVIYEEDTGPADGLSKGFAIASGDIFGFLNSDDILLPGTLQKVTGHFKNGAADVISAHGYVIDEFNFVKRKLFSNTLKQSKISLMNFCCGNTALVQPSTFFTKVIYNKVNGFDLTSNVVWDAGLFIRFILAKARFRVINDFWSCFRVYPQSLTGSGLFKNAEVFRQIQSYAGLPPISWHKKYYLKVVKWLTEPGLLFRRVADSLVNTRPMNLPVYPHSGKEGIS